MINQQRQQNACCFYQYSDLFSAEYPGRCRGKFNNFNRFFNKVFAKGLPTQIRKSCNCLDGFILKQLRSEFLRLLSKSIGDIWSIDSDKKIQSERPNDTKRRGVYMETPLVKLQHSVNIDQCLLCEKKLYKTKLASLSLFLRSQNDTDQFDNFRQGFKKLLQSILKLFPVVVILIHNAK